MEHVDSSSIANAEEGGGEAKCSLLSVLSALLGSDRQARKVLSALGAEGWVCVPETPTAEMVQAAYWHARDEDETAVWSSMIEVAKRITKV